MPKLYVLRLTADDREELLSEFQLALMLNEIRIRSGAYTITMERAPDSKALVLNALKCLKEVTEIPNNRLPRPLWGRINRILKQAGVETTKP